MSAGIVDQITLECLMNRDMYKKLMTNKTIIAQKTKEKDFYKNRISHLTEELLLNNEVDGLFTDVSFAFDNYVKTCIHYFKIIDESDIIQNDYNGLAGEQEEQDVENDDNANSLEDEDEDEDLDENLDHDEDLDEEEEEVLDVKEENEEIFVEILEDDDEDDNKDLDDDKMDMMLRSAKMMTGTLDKFMMLKPPQPTTQKKKCSDVLPTQKEINLEDPLLMNKGICKKKNVNNKYGK